MYIDVHCHLDLCKNISSCVIRAREEGLRIIVTNGVNIDNNRRVLELSSKYKEVKAALGMYPIDALKLKDKEIEEEIDFIRANKNKIVAIL